LLRVRQLAQKILNKITTTGKPAADEDKKADEEDPKTLEDYLNIFKRIQWFFVENTKNMMITIAGDLDAIHQQSKVGDLASPWVDLFVECFRTPVEQLLGKKPRVTSSSLSTNQFIKMTIMLEESH
jgi:hypothetical protein